ncbi:MAG: DUF424 family protein [Candidatus Hodarchaeota archaeon]
MTKTVFLKIHKMQGKQVLTCCDSELLGACFTEGKCCLRVTETWYKGQEISIEKAKDIIKENINKVDSFQVVGENIINFLDKCGVMGKKGVKRVQGVPHLIFIKM